MEERSKQIHGPRVVDRTLPSLDSLNPFSRNFYTKTRAMECKLDSVKVVQLLYAYMHSNSPRNLKCTKIVRDELEQRRESSRRVKTIFEVVLVQVSLEFDYTLLLPGNKTCLHYFELQLI